MSFKFIFYESDMGIGTVKYSGEVCVDIVIQIECCFWACIRKPLLVHLESGLHKVFLERGADVQGAECRRVQSDAE